MSSFVILSEAKNLFRVLARSFAALRMTILVLFVHSFAAADRPNIVLIYADDLGYGDVGCYGATEVRTPNLDRLAREGLSFTDAHSAAATCTPSRYALLTGEYAWRQKGTGILPGDAPLIIEPGRVTLASMLHDAGYTTGVVGKWHLGLGREQLVEQGRSIALRKGNWKYIEPVGQPTGDTPQPQLCNLADDLAETVNLAKKRPEKVKDLSKLLDDIRKSGRMP